MPTASRPSFLRHFGRSPARRGPDLADMGTAFALDLAMDPPDYDQAARPAPGATRSPVAPWRLWLGKKLGA